MSLLHISFQDTSLTKKHTLSLHDALPILVNASNIEKDWNWISSFNDRNVEMHNVSDKTCLLAIQGHNATKILQPLTDRKSTRLNSSHCQRSYDVFCLKKKIGCVASL